MQKMTIYYYVLCLKGMVIIMLANYHTHTTRCHHAAGEDREYVEAAIRAGMKILGFSDHAPWVYSSGFVSGIRMLPSEVEGYFDSLLGLKKEYEKDIQIFIGFESEYTPELVEAQDDLLANYPLDYLILGQHFLGPDDMAPYVGAPTDKEEILKKYVDSVIEGMKSGRFLYLAHPDLIHFTGSPEVYTYHMTRLCEKMKEIDGIMEFNVLGLADHRHYPVERFLEIAGNVGNRYILGIDAHKPEQLLNHNAIREAQELCEKYKLRLMDGMDLM